MSKAIYHSSHKYIRWYLSLVRKSQSRTTEGYSERHHVFPVSIFGKNKSVVRLTAREHFICHKLLYKIYLVRYGSTHSKTFKMLKAISFMVTRKEIRYNSRMYEECRLAYSLSMQGENNPSVKYGLSESHREKLSAAGKGRPHSEDHKENLRAASKKRKEKYGDFFNEEAYKKSLLTRIQNSKRFDFLYKPTDMIEHYMTIAELVTKYIDMNLDKGYVRKSKIKNKDGSSRYYKGWTITKEY